MAGEDNMIFGNLPPQIDWNAPPQPTFPANPADSRYSMPARIGSALGIEAGRIGRGLWSAATLPGDVATGKTTMADPQAQRRLMDLTQATTLGPGGGADAPVGAVTTGWAPSAWKKLAQLKRDYPNKGDLIDGLAGLTPDQARVMPPFSSASSNKLLDDVINAHNDDLSLVNRVREGSPYASIPLREMRGQPFDDPGSASVLQSQLPSGPTKQTLQDFLYGGQSRVQPASTPWNTFQLQQPKMPPFPANDPRLRPPRVPGITIDSTELGA